MARRLRRPQRPQRPAVVEAELEDEDELEDAELVEDDDDEEEDDELEELEDEPVKPVRTRRQAPVLQKKSPRQVVTRKIEIPKTPSKELEQAISEELQTLGDPVQEILDLLEEGKTLFVTKHKNGYLLKLSQNDVVNVVQARKGKLSWKDYEAEVCSQEYLTWVEEWQALSMEEKRKRAKKAGAVWEAHEHLQTEAMRIATSYREAVGIPKYKPEYAERAARDVVRKQFTS